MAKAKNTGTGTGTGSVATQDVDFLNMMGGEGTQCIGATDTSANYLRIAQSNTPELPDVAPDGQGIANLKIGHFYSPLLKKSYGKAVDVIVLKYEICWMVWGPDRGGLIAKLPVGGCQHIKSDDGKMHDYEGNEIQETQNFYVMLADHLEDGLMTFSVTSTGLKYGRQWNTQIVSAKTPDGRAAAPIFGVVWQIETIKNTNKKGTWFTIGLDKTAAIQQSRYITGQEWKQFVEKGYDLAKMIPALERKAISGEGQKAISSGNDALDNV